MSWYPVDPPRQLARAAAAFFDVDEESVLLGNGASELIFLVVASLRPRRVLIVGPTFTEYERAALAWGAEVDVLPLPAGRDFVLTATDLEDAGAATLIARADLLFYCDPNNPTGALLDRGARRHLLDLAEAAGTTVFADESFFAFTSAWPAGGVLREHRANVIVLHSLTKILAMPGLRLGALIVPPAYRAELRRRLTPWNINCVAYAAGLTALTETEMLAATPGAVAVARQEFVAGLAALPGVERVLPADANFVCVRLTLPRARDVVRRLREAHGVLLRDLTDFPGMGGCYVRSAVRAPEDNRRVLTALATVLADDAAAGAAAR
jgi:threonine-phosphate decarboxylase